MKTAVISDIHGNYHALNAVLEDAGKAGARQYVFLGDYFLDFPFPNEVCDSIKKLDAVFIRGNKEDYLRRLGADKSRRTYDQMRSIYWNSDVLTPENRDFLTAMPAKAEFSINGGYARAFHAPSAVFKQTAVMLFTSQNYYKEMKKKPFTREEYLWRTDDVLSRDEALLELFDRLPDGAYLFGHTHVQWHWRHNGKLLLNPGAVGTPLDFDKRAAYSIISHNNGIWTAEHRRVSYDNEAAAAALRNSSLFNEAPGWSGMILDHLRYAFDCCQFLIGAAEGIAAEKGSTSQPFANDIWNEACEVYSQIKFTR